MFATILSTCLLALTSAFPIADTYPAKDRQIAADEFKYLFFLGNSYTNIAFDPNGDQPTPSNPFGNMNMPGDDDLTGGPNWAIWLTTTFNSTPLLTWDLAYNCATVDSTFIPTCETAFNHSIVHQVEEFRQIWAMGSPYGTFDAMDSLFLMWIGINDAHWSYDKANVTDLMNQDVDKYFEQIQILYDTGARRFIFLNVPPYERTPQVLGKEPQTTQEKVAYSTLNSRLEERWGQFRLDHKDSYSMLIDTHPIFNEVLDDPSKIGLKNSTCDTAQSGKDAGCVWADDFHPGPEFHKWIAQHVVDGFGIKFLFGDFFG